ncbi:hypothetical protein F5X97DRAFT_127031 [Nemania serpens]|nr:hypothetical protein F5X97DRAFT_127031 [Nemania serpens]
MIATDDNVASSQEAPDVARDVGDSRTNLAVNTTSTGDNTEEYTSLRAPTRKDYNETQTKDENIASNILNNAALNDEDGDENENNARTLARNSSSKYDGPTLLKIEKKRGVVARRTSQAIIHTNFTELRIQDLENKLRQIQMDLYKLPKDFEVGKEEVQGHPIFIHSLQRSTPDKFERRVEMSKVPFEDQSALEILVIEKLIDSRTSCESFPFHERATGHSNTQLVPKSLRIRPRLLIAHL